VDKYTRKRGPSEFGQKWKQEGSQKGGLIVSALPPRDRISVALLNAPLFLLFGAAWIADKWPNLATSAMIIAFVIAALEFATLAWLGRRARLREDRAIDQVRRNVQQELADYEQRLAYYEQRYARRIRQQYSASHMRAPHLQMRASRVETWALNERWLEFQKEIERAQSLLKHGAPSELRKWKFVSHGAEAFNIVAGAFEIEHFHGQTNIRVLDPSRVTVEGKIRGDSKSIGVPAGVRAATYQ
jgi:hypothetical protein